MPDILKTATKVHFVSLFLENNEDQKFHSKITFVSEVSNFETFTLFGVNFKKNHQD